MGLEKLDAIIQIERKVIKKTYHQIKYFRYQLIESSISNRIVGKVPITNNYVWNCRYVRSFGRSNKL